MFAILDKVKHDIENTRWFKYDFYELLQKELPQYIVTCLVGNMSNNLRILDFMPNLLVMRQAELQSIITVAVSL
jgi:hypothetical protein